MRFPTFISLFFILVTAAQITAQNIQFELSGRDYYEECITPWCETFELSLDPQYNWLQVQFYAQPSNSVDITVNSDSLYVVCIDAPGYYQLIAEGFAFDGQTEYFLSDTVEVFLHEWFLDGDIQSSFCADSSGTDDCLRACEYSTVTYFLSSNTTVFGEWFVSGAESYTSNGNTVEVEWGASGYGYIEFIQIDPCEFIISRCVDIIPTPEPVISSTPEATNGIIQVCKGQPIYLINESTNSVRYEWTFGDGTISDNFEPEHIYETPGTYTITLTAYNACECSAETSIEVEVLPAPAPELSCVATVCPGEKIRYNATTDGCQTFHWDVSPNGTVLSGGGTSDDFIEIEWGEGPDGMIELLVENCNQSYCSKPTIFRIPIVSEDGPVTGDEFVCSGEIVSYKAPNFPGVNYTWTVSNRGKILSGQGTNAVSVEWDHVTSVVTGQSVEVTYDHCYLGCGGSDDIDVSIVPHMVITGDNNFCAQGIANFESVAGFASNTPIISSWKLFDSNGLELWSSTIDTDQPTITLNYPPGDYVVVATAADPMSVCEVQVEKEFQITPLPSEPNGIIGDSFICPGNTYSFEIMPSGNYQTLWTIYDGNQNYIYDGQIINHAFGNTPPFIVEASHADLIYPDCISTSLQKILNISSDAEIIGPDENCLETLIEYSVYDLPGDQIEWRVEPADMAEVSDQYSNAASFFWRKPGIAEVVLAVCGNEIRKQVIIHDLPIPIVDHPAGLCLNESGIAQTLTDYETYQWKDTSGTVISTDSAVRLFPGYYSVDVTDDNGCIGTATFKIDFNPAPVAHISTLGNTWQCMTVDPIELVANTDGVNYTFQWYFNGNPVGSNSPKYIAGQFGNYFVEVTNEYGCTSTSNPIELIEYCGSTGGGVCNGQTCTAYDCPEPGYLDYIIENLDCNSKRYTENITNPEPIAGTVFWDIEQSNGSYKFFNSPVAEIKFDKAGYYTIILGAKLDGFAYSDPRCHHLYAFKDTVEVAADFNFKGACANQTISFIDLSTFLPDYGITDWSWDFGDGNTSSSQHTDHIYTSPGNYNVTLEITALSGCTSTITKEVRVFSPPSLTINSPATACANTPVSFELLSTQSLFDISWDFMDPNGSNNASGSMNPYHSYSLPDIYYPEVEASNVFGCQANESTVIEIHPNGLNGAILATPGPVICEGDSAELEAPGSGYSWDWNTDEVTEQITVQTAGYYDVIVTDNNGCKYAPDPIFIEVNPKPLVKINGREIIGKGDFGQWADTVETCEGMEVELWAFSNADVNYLWSNSQTTQSISFTSKNGNLLPAGQHIFSVEVTDKITGCISDLAEILVIIHENPSSFTVSLSSGSGCSESANILQVDQTQAGITYQWSDGQTGPQITAIEGGYYRVTAINEFGCETQSGNRVHINEAPASNLFPTGCYIKCDPDTICIPPISNVSYYELRLNNTVVSSGSNVPGEWITSQSGTYELYLEGTQGCISLSDPLNLELFSGFGHVDILVFVDVNENGSIDAGDTTIRNIDVILQQNNTIYDRELTDNTGSSYFLNIPANNYVAKIDTTSIPTNLIAIIGEALIEITGCDMEFTDTLLLAPEIIPLRDTIDLFICAGDSIEIDGNKYWEGQTIETTIAGPVVDTIRTYHISVFDEIQFSEVYTDACSGEDNGAAEIMATSSNGPVLIEWLHNGSNDYQIESLASGIYEYNLNDGQCELTDSIEIGVNIFPDIDAVSKDPECPDDLAGEIIINSSDMNVLWSLDSVSFHRDPLQGLSPGTYTVYFKDENCYETEEFTIESRNITPFAIDQNLILPPNTEFVLSHNYLDSINYNFNWTPEHLFDCPDCIEPVFPGSSEDVEFSVFVTDTFGCEQEAIVRIRVDNSDFVFIPNAFSPNGDAINDHFKPFVKEDAVRTTKLEVFDRWGNMVYLEESNSELIDITGWDGRKNGRYENPGLFIYRAQFKYTNGDDLVRFGEVHLIR